MSVLVTGISSLLPGTDLLGTCNIGLLVPIQDTGQAARCQLGVKELS